MRQCSHRIFLKCGLSACSANALIPTLSARPVVPYHKVVFDERLKETGAFATRATALGDITNSFFNHLDLRWKLGAVWLIGFTTSASLFCLHLLARDRMRMHLPSSGPSDLPLSINARSARASAKEIAIA
jgi:hypothetical protein